jgi:hypothetical protein
MPESTRQRLAFDRYFRLGGQRSIELLHSELAREGQPPSLRTLYEWSRRYHWQSRLADLERQAREAEDAARITAIREMQERQAKAALLLQQKGVEWLAQLPADEVSADAAIRALVEGAKLERLVRGEATERTEQRQASDPRLEELSDAELDRLIDDLA